MRRAKRITYNELPEGDKDYYRYHLNIFNEDEYNDFLCGKHVLIELSLDLDKYDSQDHELFTWLKSNQSYDLFTISVWEHFERGNKISRKSLDKLRKYVEGDRYLKSIS